MTTTQKSVLEAAQELVEANVEAEPAITKAYLFPAADQIRLVYVDTEAGALREDERIAPFYFGASKMDGLPYGSAVALIPPEVEDRENVLPEGWGHWDQAKIIWEKG